MCTSDIEHHWLDISDPVVEIMYIGFVCQALDSWYQESLGGICEIIEGIAFPININPVIHGETDIDIIENSSQTKT